MWVSIQRPLRKVNQNDPQVINLDFYAILMVRREFIRKNFELKYFFLNQYSPPLQKNLEVVKMPQHFSGQFAERPLY